MTTKDYVYLGLIALSTVVFYWNGYYAGAARTRRMFERWFAATDSSETAPDAEFSEPADLEVEERPMLRHRLQAVPAPTIRVTFGRN